MTLRLRLMLAFGLLALVTAALYGTLTYVVYQRQQWAQLESLLERELGRMQGTFADPRLGVPLLSSERGGTIVQLVTPEGRVVLPRDSQTPLPASDAQEVVPYQGGYYLAALRRLTGGNTLRLGLDVTDEIASRTDLARHLVWLGLIMALLAALLGGLLARRALAPLASLARQARAIDSAEPAAVEYHGPTDEVAEVASALNDALANIRSRRGEERAFLGELAHELAAPLTLVKGHLDAFERHAAKEAREGPTSHPNEARETGPTDDLAAMRGPGAARNHLQAAREAAQELLLTSQDLLSLARGELERPAQNEVLRLDELLDRLGRAYPEVTISCDGPVRVVGDRHQLLQATRNLVRNAVQATGGGSGVTVELNEYGERVELKVRDSGPGIPPDRLDRIFERYYSGSSGAGVGLTVVSRVIERHGGELQVETGPSGSCFTIVLPSFAAQLTTAH